MTFLLAAALVLISLLAYSPFFGIELMEFDTLPKLVFLNGTGAGQALKIFTQPDSPSSLAVWYRPIPSFIWWSIFMLRGIDFQAFHSFNFALHALNTALVFLLAKKLIGSKNAFFPFMAALAFALHPINLNTVLFVSRLPEMLVAFGLLASLLSLIAFFESRGRRFYLLSIAFCFFGIFSKETGVLIPIVLLFYCLAFLKGKRFSRLSKKSLRLCIPFFSLVALYLALMIFSLERLSGYFSSFTYSGSQLAFFFFANLFLPIGPLAPIALAQSFLGQALPNALALIAIAAAAFSTLLHFSKGKENRPALFLFCWIFLFLLAFVAFGLVQPWYAYIPLIPFTILLGIFLKRHAPKARASQASLAITLAASLLFLSFILLFPLAVSYPQPLAAAELTQTILSQAEEIAGGLPPQSTLYLVNFPRLLASGEKGFRHTIPLVDRDSVQAWLHLKLPEKKPDIVSLTSYTLLSTQPGEKQFAFSQKEGRTFLMENLNTTTANIRTSPSWTPEKARVTGITLNYTQSKSAETIELILPNEVRENTFFLFFDGKQVRAIRVES